MCGIAAIFGGDVGEATLTLMNQCLAHRGPDGAGVFLDDRGICGLGHTRLAVLDLSDRGAQPMSDISGRYWISFNGEIYNYAELQSELGGPETFRSFTDTEVLLRAFLRWGKECLSRLQGMFAFVIWDRERRELFAARDRFGVKPLYWGNLSKGQWVLGSEIKALFAAGLRLEANGETWATYLAQGVYEHGETTFWSGVRRLPAGCCMEWRDGGSPIVTRWYDVIERVREAGPDDRTDHMVTEELLGLIDESIRLRFRSDVPVGVCVSGGLDSALLVRALLTARPTGDTIQSYTFYCGDPHYDEIPWVRQTLAGSGLGSVECRLRAEEVPALAARVAKSQDEPFGAIPTLGMAKVHESARERGTVVLLDASGIDEGWAGYDYFQKVGQTASRIGEVQGAHSRATRPDCLSRALQERANHVVTPQWFPEEVLNLQARDLLVSKLPRAMRFTDRVSMMESREVREPFLDHRIIELGLRQPLDRRIRQGQGKWLMREAARRLLPTEVREAPKRSIQTPQREWLRGPLRTWVEEKLRVIRDVVGEDWFIHERVDQAWEDYLAGGGDNSFWVWQWVSLGLLIEQEPAAFQGAF